MRSAVPQKFKSGNAARKSVMKALMSARPFRGSCSEYFSSMSGAAISSTISRLQVLPQKSVNHRPTTALLSDSLLMLNSECVVASSNALDDAKNDNRARHTEHSVFCSRIEMGFESKKR